MARYCYLNGAQYNGLDPPQPQTKTVGMNNWRNAGREDGAEFLPDFCSGSAVFSMLVITELVAVLITLAAVDASPVLWERFLLLSIYLQWIGISSAAGLCMVRRYVRGLSERAVAGLCYLLLLLITLLLSEIAWRLAVYQDFFLVLQTSHAEFLTRNLGVCSLIAALALRYFWVQHQRQRQLLALGDARFVALQARIRPHFLFNTLNSIAELTNSQPRDAESAVEDLSVLLRASLAEHDQPVTLAKELATTRAYARIEGLRLGDRLRVDWDIPEELQANTIPPLSLQPLVENAVRHGIEPLPEGGTVQVRAIPLDDSFYVISVTNPIDESADRPGSGEALENIRLRLRWLYGENGAEIQILPSEKMFEARLILPRRPVSS